jgi:hypothetical protein
MNKDGSLGSQGAISSIVEFKNEWSSTSTPPLSLCDRKGDVLCQLNAVTCVAKNKEKIKIYQECNMGHVATH